jgi:hypothetical protein
VAYLPLDSSEEDPDAIGKLLDIVDLALSIEFETLFDGIDAVGDFTSGGESSSSDGGDGGGGGD